LATINEDVTVGAICVPKMIDGKYVVGICNKSKTLRRLYFEKGCPIRYIMSRTADDSAGFNGTSYIVSGGVAMAQHKGFVQADDINAITKATIVTNDVLEYVDLAALTQLHTIGGLMGTAITTDGVTSYSYENPVTDGSDTYSRVFAYCPNLHISNLPDSVMIIGKHAFSDDTSLSFDALPAKTTIIEERAFYGDTGLTNVSFSNAQWRGNNEVSVMCNIHNSSTEVDPRVVMGVSSGTWPWPYIGANAFNGCKNLVFTTTGSDGVTVNSTDFKGPLSIAGFAF
jgi:hypothetical protein